MSAAKSWWLAACLLAPPVGAAAVEVAAAEPLEVWLVNGEQSAAGEALSRAVELDLERTPRRHELHLAAPEAPAAAVLGEQSLALLAIGFGAVERPRLELARAGDVVTPGWLVHAVVIASARVGVATNLADGRSSWIGQLVERSTDRRLSDAASAALARGVPSVRVILPRGAEAAAARALAATVRRLDGLDGRPSFEDEFLLAGGRVWLRRDLYWLGLAVWLALFWRGRGRPGQELRWALLGAWLVAPVFAAVLLTLPALVAAWRPGARWPAALALLPAVVYAARWSAALAAGALPVIALLPTLLVAATLGLFAWYHLLRRQGQVGEK
jgi:hypothetical protein